MTAKKEPASNARKRSTSKRTTQSEKTVAERAARYPTVALVLQGGGALGAYQCGVYEGLHQAGIRPNWIAGISIGAINAALIAGNPPEKRMDALNTFWNEICRPSGTLPLPALWMRNLFSMLPQGFELDAWSASMSAIAALWEGQQGFFLPRLISPYALSDGTPAATSFYDTAPLRGTLERLVDFDRINDRKTMRLTVGATEVETGNFRYFDSMEGSIGPEHIMASGALPPAFPAVEIEGKFYWDGGVVSNTPLEHILDTWPRQDTLALQVDLWSASGELPRTMMDVFERAKDIQYSSRTRHGTDMVARTQQLRTSLTDLIERLPEKRIPDDLADAFAQWMDDRVFNIIHFIYQAKPGEQQFKDYAFDEGLMREHWQAGLRDTEATIRHPEFFDLPRREKGFALHDVHRKVQKTQISRF